MSNIETIRTAATRNGWEATTGFAGTVFERGQETLLLRHGPKTIRAVEYMHPSVGITQLDTKAGIILAILERARS